jgi:hypothetical protein
MMNYRLLSLSVLTLSLIGLGACSNAKEKLGLEKKSPDEFAVVKRAPLAMPPDYTLRPPSPGAPRPQEAEPSAQAKQTVFGENLPQTQGGVSEPEAILLQQAGAGNIDPAIRAKVDAETAATVEDKRPVAKKLLNIMSGSEDPSASVVDPAKEAERIQANKETGKPITEGNTPAVVQ